MADKPLPYGGREGRTVEKFKGSSSTLRGSNRILRIAFPCRTQNPKTKVQSLPCRTSSLKPTPPPAGCYAPIRNLNAEQLRLKG